MQWGRWGFLPRKARSCGADGGGSAFSSSQRECVLTVANEVQLSTRRVHSATQRKRALYFSFTLLKQLASKKRPALPRNCKQKATRSASVTDDQSALSSHEKILRLIVLRSNLKSNLQILFAETHTLKMLNLNPRRFVRAKQCPHFSRAVGLERVWERKGRRFVSRTSSSPEEKRKVDIKGSTFASLHCVGYRRCALPKQLASKKRPLCSPCACTLFESCRAERNSSPYPSPFFYNKVKITLDGCFCAKKPSL